MYYNMVSQVVHDFFSHKWCMILFFSHKRCMIFFFFWSQAMHDFFFSKNFHGPLLKSNGTPLRSKTLSKHEEGCLHVVHRRYI